MKFKTTIREIKSNYWPQVAGYGDVQTIFWGISPVAYTCGVYGWNMDVYTDPEFPSLCICTGYRPTGKEYLTSKELRAYEKKARAIMDNHEKSYDSKRKSLAKLRHQLFEELQKRVQEKEA